MAEVAVCCKKVMVVEDDKELRQLIKLSLDLKTGARVVTASDGFMALMMARGELPDLILMDLDLPYVDGFEAIRLIKSDARTRHIPIMALTNHGWDFDWQQKTADLGCVRCLYKPQDVTQLTNIVRDFLSA
jgi:CheY-like chemotaxis protein